MAKQTEEICRFLEDKRQFTEKLVYYQEQKGALTARYDDLFESFNLTLDSERVLEIESEETATRRVPATKRVAAADGAVAAGERVRHDAAADRAEHRGGTAEWERRGMLR